MNCGYSDSWLYQYDTTKISGAESLFRQRLYQMGLWAHLWVIAFTVFIDVQRLSLNVWVASDYRPVKRTWKNHSLHSPCQVYILRCCCC